MNMENFATEILIEVFSYLDLTSKKNLLLTNKRFNKIISDSTQLMKSCMLTFDVLEVNWDEKVHRRRNGQPNLCLYSILSSNRKYQHLLVKSQSTDRRLLKQIIVRFGCHLKSVNFNRVTVTKIDFLKILTKLALLEDATFDVDFDKSQSSGATLKFKVPICPNLKTLVLEGFESHDLDFYMQLFNDSVKKLEHFQIKSSVDQYDGDELRNFLIDQRNLKTLKLLYLNISGLFEKDFSADVPFKLETIEIHNVQLDNNRVINFVKFMNFQTNLRSIHILDEDYRHVLCRPDDIFKCILKLKKLKSMELNMDYFQFASPAEVFSTINPSIETFVYRVWDIHTNSRTIGYMLVDRLARCMPNLQKLEINCFQEITSNDLICLNKLNLVELNLRTIGQNCVKDLCLPKLKKIVLNAFEEDDFNDNQALTEPWINFFKTHKNLEYFSFECWAEFSEEILEVLFDQLRNLKYLELGLSKKNSKAAEIIAERHKMLKDLEYIKVYVVPVIFTPYEVIFDKIFTESEGFVHRRNEYLPFYDRFIQK
jgi:hypothetical protein